MLDEVAKNSAQKYFDIMKCKKNAAKLVLQDFEEAFSGNKEMLRVAQGVYSSQIKAATAEFEAQMASLQNKIVKNTTLIV